MSLEQRAGQTKPPPPEYGRAPKLELLMAWLERIEKEMEEKAATLEQKTA